MKPQAHILLVEDDHAARVTLELGLKQANYRVTTASTGLEAIDLLEQDTFAVVLTDLVLGDVTGLEVLYTARNQPYHPVIIILTGHGSLETSLTAFRNGAFDYLLKPCEPHELLTRVGNAVMQYNEQNQIRAAARTLYRQLGDVQADQAHPALEMQMFDQPIQIANLVVGTSRRDVSLNGKQVVLTPIEYTLLRFLAIRPGVTRGYTEIVRVTHQVDTDETEAQILIRPHMHNLRKKIEGDYLVTDRGVGYQLVDPSRAQR